MSDEPQAALLDAFVSALLDDDASLLLVELDGRGARLASQATPRQIVISCGDAASTGDAIRRAVRLLNVASAPVDFVALGRAVGDDGELRRALPLVQPVPLSIHRIEPSGAVARLAGRGAPNVERAAARLQTTAVDRARLADALMRGSAVARQEAHAVTKLRGAYAVTAVIAAACIVMYLATLACGDDRVEVALYRLGGDFGTSVLHGQVWRLLASAFLHLNATHIALNLYALVAFGGLLEALLGRRRYVILYAAAALGGSLASSMLSPHRLSVGASGAIFGLMGGGIGVALRPRGLLPPGVVAQTRRRLLVPLGINLAYSLTPGIDMFAHVGGALTGFVLAATVLTRGLTPVAERTGAEAERGPAPLVTAACAFAALAMAASIGVAVLVGRPWILRGPLVFHRVPIAATGLTVELPESVLDDDTEVTEADGKATVVRFASLKSSEIAFVLIVVDTKVPLTGDVAKRLLERERAALDEQPPDESAKETSKAEIAPLGSSGDAANRWVIRATHATDALEIRTTVVFVGTNEILVRSYASKHPRPERWTNVEDRVAASIALEAPR